MADALPEKINMEIILKNCKSDFKGYELSPFVTVVSGQKTASCVPALQYMPSHLHPKCLDFPNLDFVFDKLI